MKSLKLAWVGAGLLIGASFCPVNAADIDGGLKDEAVYLPGVVWTGIYVGVHAGGGWSSANVTDVDAWWGPAGHTFGYDTSGFLGGAQMGYNWQSGRLLLGLEAELGYLGLSGGAQDPLAAAAGFPVNSGYASISTDFYGTLTGRVGLTSDRWLIYAKGGAAFLDTDANYIDQAGVTLISGTENAETLSGWVIGGGAEYALDNCWSVKAEYLHFDFGNITVTAVDSVFGASYRFTQDITVDTAKIGINYRFAPREFF